MNNFVQLLRLTTQILIAQSIAKKCAISNNIKLSLEDANLSKKVVSQSDLDTQSWLDLHVLYSAGCCKLQRSRYVL